MNSMLPPGSTVVVIDPDFPGRRAPGTVLAASEHTTVLRVRVDPTWPQPDDPVQLVVDGHPRAPSPPLRCLHVGPDQDGGSVLVETTGVVATSWDRPVSWALVRSTGALGRLHLAQGRELSAGGVAFVTHHAPPAGRILAVALWSDQSIERVRVVGLTPTESGAWIVRSSWVGVDDEARARLVAGLAAPTGR